MAKKINPRYRHLEIVYRVHKVYEDKPKKKATRLYELNDGTMIEGYRALVDYLRSQGLMREYKSKKKRLK